MFFFQFYHQHWIKQGHKGSTVLDIAGCDQLAMTGAKHHPLSMTWSQSAMLIALGAPLLLPGTQLSVELSVNVPCIALPSSGSMQQTMCVKAHSQKPDLPAELKSQKQHFPLPKHEAVHLRT